MNTHQASQRGSEHCHLSNRAWRQIRAELEKKLDRKLDNWTGPEIVTESGTYKLDWNAPDDLSIALSEEYVTLYDDGVWQFYGKDGEIEGASPAAA